MLVNSGLSPHQRDAYGQTPIHLASISGNVRSCIDLVDKVHYTPFEKGSSQTLFRFGRQDTLCSLQKGFRVSP